jgi:hypothetical protein
MYDKVISYIDVCPRLYYLLHMGVGSCDCAIALNKDITTFRQENRYVRGYRFEAFKEDFMLAQQFTFEETILTNAEEIGCKNIVKLLSKKFTD